MCVYRCVYVHVCSVHVCAGVFVHPYVQVCAYTCMYRGVHTCMSRYVYVQIGACVHVWAGLCMCVYGVFVHV